MKQYISATTVSNNGRIISSTHDIEPESCAYIIKNGMGYPMPRSSNWGLGDRVLETVGPWSSQKSLYKRLAFLSDDDMAALQTILTSRGFSAQTFIQVKILPRKPWSRKGSAVLVILKDNNLKPFEKDEPMPWRSLRDSNASKPPGDVHDFQWIDGGPTKMSAPLEPNTRLGATTYRTTAIPEPSGLQPTMSYSSADKKTHREVQDVSTALMDPEDFIRELTTYRVWIIQPHNSQNTSSWAKCTLEEENLSHEEAARRVVELDKSGVSILDKKLALQLDQRYQVHRLLERVVAQQSSPEYKWILRQLEMPKERKKGLRRIRPTTCAIVVYLARSPKPGTDLLQLHHRDAQGIRIPTGHHENHRTGVFPLPTEDDVSIAPPAPSNHHGPPQGGTRRSPWERYFLDLKVRQHKGQPPASPNGKSRGSLGVGYFSNVGSDTETSDSRGISLDESQASVATKPSRRHDPERTRRQYRHQQEPSIASEHYAPRPTPRT